MPNLDLSNLVNTDEKPTRRLRIPLGGIIYAALLVIGGAVGLGVAQEHGHFVPSQICFTFDNGDKPCYDTHHDHARLGYFR